jgi:hypothetical protein
VERVDRGIFINRQRREKTQSFAIHSIRPCIKANCHYDFDVLPFLQGVEKVGRALPRLRRGVAGAARDLCGRIETPLQSGGLDMQKTVTRPPWVLFSTAC